MSEQPTLKFDFQQLHQPRSLTHPGWQIRLSDLVLFALVFVGWCFAVELFLPQAAYGADAIDVFEQSVRRDIMVEFVSFTAALVGLWGLVRARELPNAATGINWPSRWLLIATPILTVLFSMLFSTLLALAFNEVSTPGYVEYVRAVRTARQSDPTSLILFFLTVVVVKPIVVNWVFRGWLFNWLRVRTSFWTTAIAVTGIYVASQYFLLDSMTSEGQFSAAVWFVLYYAAMGLVFSALAEFGRSIWPAALMHGLYVYLLIS